MRLLHFFVIALLLFGQADCLKWWQINTSQTVPYIQMEGIKNIKAYGAIGDNVTDDTAAIQAAFDGMEQGDVMVVPTGQYKNFECYFPTAQRLQPSVFRELFMLHHDRHYGIHDWVKYHDQQTI